MAIPLGAMAAQHQDQEEREVTLIGCVMRESQFRDMYGPGLTGPRGPGLGGRNEYMLVEARDASAETPVGTTGITDVPGTCSPTPGTFPTAYELTGSREGEVRAFLGRRVELSGLQKRAHTRPVGTSGVQRPTGGFD